jgi:NAD(P)-dependent dehydrogenase (short-subunit alcohol dehydrogenase family)
MAFTADTSQFDFGGVHAEAFAGKRVLITGSGKDGGIGQGVALAAAMNGAEVVGVHFNSSYRDGFDLVDAIRDQGVHAFALQADVTSHTDLWASRSYTIEQMGGHIPDVIICNSGLTESGYRFGRSLPEIEDENMAERRARVRSAFMANLTESRLVMNTKIDGFLSWTHLWASEAIYHNSPLQLVYVSSSQAIDPGVSVPGYVIANWAVLRLPEVLRVNLGKSADMVSACSVMFPFIRTSMTEEYAENEKVFGRWQSRMLETHEAALSVAQLLSRPAAELDLGCFRLNVSGDADNLRTEWSKVLITTNEEPVNWGS